ncbi:MAG: DUF4153 domain-containing protein [Caulobacter sp.]|nr:DUF4153 domain-containing protein [Caulobacter sp.]
MAWGMEERTVSPVIGWARIATGLAQGLLLWGLVEATKHKVWPATDDVTMGALSTVAAMVPIVLLGGLAEIRRLTLIIWASVAAVVLAGLAVHDVASRATENPGVGGLVDDGFWFAAGLFIAHHLVAAADADRKLIARFATYFDLAWKHGVQLVMSAAFVGVFWLVLALGAGLFKLIGIDFVAELIAKPWFALPASGAMFAAAVQLTDVRHGLIRGIRTVALTLLSWLLPVLAFLTGAFLVALPFTGLEPLWESWSATGILLSASAVMIILINAAYQDGEPDTPTPLILRWAARLGGLLLIPLIGLAGYALSLRIGQYGLTPDRILGVACVIAGACYAVGYAVAAVLPGAWMKLLELTNVVTAFVTVGLILALFSPLADPAKLSVNDQMARIADGRLKPDKVDYRFLRFDSERYGVAALETLKKKGGETGKRAAVALTATNRYAESELTAAANAEDIAVWPKGRILPPEFLARAWDEFPQGRSWCRQTRSDCDAVFVDLDGDGHEEIVLRRRDGATVYERRADNGWAVVGTANGFRCDGAVQALREGRFKLVAPRWRDFEINGLRVHIDATWEGCDGTPGTNSVTIVNVPPKR